MSTVTRDNRSKSSVYCGNNAGWSPYMKSRDWTLDPSKIVTRQTRKLPIIEEQIPIKPSEKRVRFADTIDVYDYTGKLSYSIKMDQYAHTIHNHHKLMEEKEILSDDVLILTHKNRRLEKKLQSSAQYINTLRRINDILLLYPLIAILIGMCLYLYVQRIN